MRKSWVFILFVFLTSLIGVPSSPVSAAEKGIPDAKPTPFVSCGGILCSYLLGKHFVFGGVDIDSSGKVGDLGQFPCQVDQKMGTDFCRVFPKNAPPSNNLSKVILRGGYVELGQAFTCDVSPTSSCRPNPFLEMKIVLTGGGAKFDLYPYAGFTFSEDRKTIYINKNATFVESNYQLPRIIAHEIGSIEVTAFLEVSPGEYSTSGVESGKILVISKKDNFIFQRLTQQDLKKSPNTKIKLMQREISCAKGKTVRKIMKNNIYDIKCPAGFKIQ
jgi:hypothetical protein